jgi:hypothetical protein
MKKVLGFLLSIWMFNPIMNAQEDVTTDTTKISLGSTVVSISSGDKKEKEKKTAKDYNYWSGLDFGVNGYFTDKSFGINNDPDNIFMELNYARSFNLNLNIYEYSANLGSEKILFVTGLGFRFNRYAFKNTNTTLSFNDTTIFPQLDTVNKFNKNFLNTSYISLPLMFALVPGENAKKSFHISMGVIGSYRLGSRIKQRYEFNNQNLKDIKRGHYHINPFLLDATVRVGVGRFTLYANYGLTGLFEKGKGPEYYPFSIGLASRF